MKTLVSPSILSADFAVMGQTCAELEKCGADWIHFDVMDGVFVPNITFGMKMVKDSRKCSNLFYDVHLMIVSPEKYVEQFADCGADCITFHIEATQNVQKTIDLIKSKGKKVGLSVKPNTPIEAVEAYVDQIDMVLVMTVEPGFGGQKLIPSCLDKVAALRAKYPRLLLQVDGGITIDNAAEAVRAGANVLVAGSSVFGAEDKAEVIKKLQNV